jgi:hypothetical protein
MMRFTVKSKKGLAVKIIIPVLTYLHCSRNLDFKEQNKGQDTVSTDNVRLWIALDGKNRYGKTEVI